VLKVYQNFQATMESTLQKCHCKHHEFEFNFLTNIPWKFEVDRIT